MKRRIEVAPASKEVGLTLWFDKDDLQAIDETHSHLFFGREQDTEQLVELVARTPLVMVSGDSGSGKSSLVRAGLIPRFRGGALSVLDGERDDTSIWHVIVTRPRGAPWRELGDAVADAAKPLGLSVADRHSLAEAAASGDLERVRRALRCDLPTQRTRVLLVVDQFEELLTVTPATERDRFVELLLHLADPLDLRFRVVLTMRHDYVNLCPKALRDRLDSLDRRARFLLGRMADDGLMRSVTEPLRLAGIEEADRLALANSVRRDVGQRPGDLTLVQMALTETWQLRDKHDGDLLRAYDAVGRVEGALARAAEVVFQRLSHEEQGIFEALLVRLVRLGDTGGATRRTAYREEFDDPVWDMAQFLAGKQGKRLLFVGGSEERPTVEIAHEALVVSWPRLQGRLQELADDLRTFHALMPRAQAWQAAVEQANKEVSPQPPLAVGADLEAFQRLSQARPDWFSTTETDFVKASATSAQKQQLREQLLQRSVAVFAALSLVAAIIAGIFYARASKNATLALEALDAAFVQQARLSVRASELALQAFQPEVAARFALAALPKDPASPDRPLVPEAVGALRNALLSGPMNVLGRHPGSISDLAVLPDGRVVGAESSSRLRIWNPASPGEGIDLGHGPSTPRGSEGCRRSPGSPCGSQLPRSAACDLAPPASKACVAARHRIRSGKPGARDKEPSTGSWPSPLG